MAWTIRWRIVASFGIVLAAMVIMGAVTYAGLVRIRTEIASVATDSIPGLSHSMDTNSALLETFVTMEQFAIQQDLESQVDPPRASPHQRRGARRRQRARRAADLRIAAACVRPRR